MDAYCEPEHYTTAEAAERLRIKPDSVAKQIKRGEIAAIKVGKLGLIQRKPWTPCFSRRRLGVYRYERPRTRGKPPPRCTSHKRHPR
jgi:excisionase family DNA binding protein